MLKSIAQLSGAVRSIPLLLCYVLLRHVLGKDRALSLASEAAARVPGLLGLYTRQVF